MSAARLAGPYRSFVTWRLEWVSKVAREKADEIYRRECGLDIRRLRVLRVAGEVPGPTVSEVVARTMFERTLVSRLIGDLVTRGLVERRISPTDARQYRIDVTPKGARVLAHADRLGRALNDDLLSVLDPEERALFDRCLDKLMGWRTERMAAADAEPSREAPR